MRHVLTILGIPFVLLTSCEQTNKSYFESFTDVRIPTSQKVINDTFQDSGRSRGEVLEIVLDAKSKSDLVGSIKSSQFYNPSIYTDGDSLSHEQFKKVENKYGVWYRNKTGFSFFGLILDPTKSVTAVVDTINLKAKFQSSN
jgi:hypothetical protein